MKPVNKTKDLWNKDLKLEMLRNGVSPMCCWLWCIYWHPYPY